MIGTPQTIHRFWKAGGGWHGGGTFGLITEPISPLFETFLPPAFVQNILR